MPRIAPIVCAVVLTMAPVGASHAFAADSSDTTVDTSNVTDTTFVYDLENDPSQCIGFYPKPGCGKKPQASGDRGGWMQYTVFGVMLGALAVIGTVLVRNVIKRDRAMSEEINQK
jgi:hypothetical protein